MRVILNMATLRSHGSAWVGQGVLAGLGRTATDHQFLAFVPAQWDPALFAGYDHIQIQPVANGWRGKLLAELKLIPAAFSSFKADRLFSLTNNGLLKSPVPHLLLVHQAYLAYQPAELRFPLPPRFRLKLRLLAWLFRLSMQSVHHFTVQSGSMQRHLCARWGIKPTRVSVIPSAVDVDTHGAGPRPRDTAQRPYVCYVAGGSPHKNFTVVIDMLGELKRRGIQLDCHLTLHPEQFPTIVQRAKQLEVETQIVWRGPLSRGEVFNLMVGAQVLVMPSWLESFGLPYFEALALECPIVASDLDFAHDACGDGALYADPASASAFADQVQKLVTDSALRENLKARQRQRYQSIACSWDTIAQRYVSLLETMPA
jgi:glycosyltransferase involved in cell wall biosynthesis